MSLNRCNLVLPMVNSEVILAQRSLLALESHSAMAELFENSTRKGASSWENMVAKSLR
jgi:hypothetical protein